MRHWRKLCNLKWFMEGRIDRFFDGVKSWREDKKQKDISAAKALLHKAVNAGDIGATKKLLDVAIGKKNPVGRPRKETGKPVDTHRMANITELHNHLSNRNEV